jgi:hypothetical protein
MAIRRFIVTLCIVIVSAFPVFIAMQPHAQAAAPVAPDSSAANEASSCQAILTRALETLHNTCDKLNRNSACYGNNNIQAELTAAQSFSTMGDKVPIQIIKTMTTSPLDESNGTWGLSLLKLQANLPDTMPGQNVTFLVYGNTSIQNVSGNMQTFYFSSGLGSPNCKEAPQDAIIVRSPNHTEVSFNANGVQITIASTIVLRATRHQSMSVQLVEGHARVTAAGGSQTLQPGQLVTMPMGGENGLQPLAAPSIPAAAPSDPNLLVVLNTVQQVTSPDAPINFTLDGCITRLDGENTAIFNQDVRVDRSSGLLKNAKVGQCLRIEGTLQQSPDGTIVLIPSVVKPRTQAKANSGGNNSANSTTGSVNSGSNNSSTSDNSGSGEHIGGLGGNSGEHRNDDKGNDNGKQGNEDNGNHGGGDMGDGNGDMGDKGDMGDS